MESLTESSESIEEDIYYKSIFNSIKQVRYIVKLFRRSPVKMDLLKEYIKKEFKDQTKKSLILDVKTRWSSLYDMLCRFLELEKLVMFALIDLSMVKYVLSSKSIENLKTLCKYLELIKLRLLTISKRECNIEKADIVYSFIFDKLKNQDEKFCQDLLLKMKCRIESRRNTFSLACSAILIQLLFLNKN